MSDYLTNNKTHARDDYKLKLACILIRMKKFRTWVSAFTGRKRLSRVFSSKWMKLLRDKIRSSKSKSWIKSSIQSQKKFRKLSNNPPRMTAY